MCGEGIRTEVSSPESKGEMGMETNCRGSSQPEWKIELMCVQGLGTHLSFLDQECSLVILGGQKKSGPMPKGRKGVSCEAGENESSQAIDNSGCSVWNQIFQGRSLGWKIPDRDCLHRGGEQTVLEY